MTVTVETEFGAGPAEPYERALRSATPTLTLRDVAEPDGQTSLDLARFLSGPSAHELRMLRTCPGPVLDVGCGPGRMLDAALRCGHAALGVDVSEASVALARERGLPARRRSVFSALPDEGRWGTVLLMDGNIGIGGDPPRLLARCAALLAPGGVLLIETHPHDTRDRRFHAVLVDAAGATSLPFPWAEIGARALRSAAGEAGLALQREWRSDGRAFARYVRVA